MITCARMFPDVQPWEVMEICRQSGAFSLESGSADFVLYVEQLMRWRAEVGNTKYGFFFNHCKMSIFELPFASVSKRVFAPAKPFM